MPARASGGPAHVQAGLRPYRHAPVGRPSFASVTLLPDTPGVSCRNVTVGGWMKRGLWTTAQGSAVRDSLGLVRCSDLPPVPEALVSRPARRAEAIGRGISSAELSGPLWDRPYRGVVSWRAAATDDTWWRICAAAQLLPEGGCVGGWAAANWQGVRMLDGVRWTDSRPAPVLLNLPPHTQLRRRPGIAPFRGAQPAPPIVVAGLPVAPLAEAVYQELCRASCLVEGVVVMDMGISERTGDPHTSLADIAALVDSRPGARGIRRARAAIGLACNRSANPQETRTRMLWRMDAALPPPEVNCPIFDLDGQLLGIADLFEPASGTVTEYDGSGHRAAAAHTEDNDREERFERHNLTVVRVTDIDLRRKPRRTVARMRDGHRRGLARDRGKDRWTIEPPSWWRDGAVPGRV